MLRKAPRRIRNHEAYGLDADGDVALARRFDHHGAVADEAFRLRTSPAHVEVLRFDVSGGGGGMLPDPVLSVLERELWRQGRLMASAGVSDFARRYHIRHYERADDGRVVAIHSLYGKRGADAPFEDRRFTVAYEGERPVTIVDEAEGQRYALPIEE